MMARLPFRMRCFLVAAFSLASRADTGPDAQSSLELVDPKTLRVCADPRNTPFSTQGGEGFENKLAEMFAQQARQGPRL